MKAGLPSGVTTASNVRTPQIAISHPSTPPVIDSNTLSTSNCRITRQRLAPRAARMEISRDRPTARPSNRFATLAHAINSTNATAPRSAVNMTVIFGPLNCSLKVCTTGAIPWFVSG